MAKTVRILDSEAVELINARAKHEHRPAANAAAATIVEALRGAYGKQPEDTAVRQNWQDKIITKNSSPG